MVKNAKENPGDVRPVPDPTSLTTQQLETAIENLRQLFEVRLAGMDKAVELLQKEKDTFPNRVDEKLTAIAAVQDERFRSIAVQFRDSRAAMDSAFQAAKEAVIKSELTAMKQIDGQGILIQTATKALDDKLNDLKERLTRMEGSGAGKDSARHLSQATGQYIIAIIGTVIGVAGVLIAFLR